MPEPPADRGAAPGRRRLLGLPAALLGLELASACRGGLSLEGQYSGPGVGSEPDGIGERLSRHLDALAAAGYPVGDLVPGLSEDAIENAAAELSFPLPVELRRLYAWRDGTMPDSDLFFVRDHRLLSLRAGRSALPWLLPYGVTRAFPFAGFEGAHLVLPADAWSLHPRLERPVVSVFEGVDIHYLSFARMLDTATAWVEEGVHAPGAPVDPARELEIWRRHNPGLFGG